MTANSKRKLSLANKTGWPMFFTPWGTRISSSESVAGFEAPRLKNSGYALAIEW